MKVDADELYCLEFFQIRSLVKLPGLFDSEFWEQVLLQLSCTQSAVFHAVIALASTQRSQEFTACMRDSSENPFIDYDSEVERWDRFALKQYNKAITHLRSHFEDNSHHSVQVALATCILFICIEFMRGSYSMANVHIDHGINVLRNLQWRLKSNASVKTSTRTIIRASEPKTVDDHLMEILARMNTQCVLFGYPSRYLHATDTEFTPMYRLPDMFVSPEESRQYFEVLMGKILRLVDKSNPDSLYLPPDETGDHLIDTKQELLEALDSWTKTHERTESSLAATLKLRAYLGFIILRIYSIMIKIMLLTCAGPNEVWDEMVFDKYTDLFKDLMRTSSDMVMMTGFPGKYTPNTSGCRIGPLNFSADMGAVAPLYYTALKCRVPYLRRHAIQLLKIAPHREAVWDGAAVAGAAEEVVRLEEGDFFRLNSNESTQSLFSLQQDPLPASHRFQDVQILMEDGLKPRGKVMCRRRRIKNDGFDTSFDDSEWETIEKWFKCDDRIATYTWTNIQSMYKASRLDCLDG
jgi:Fungal specific transcription factor domain